MDEFNNEQILDEKIKKELKKDVYISEKANKIFDKFSSGDFNVSELENERIKIEEKGCGNNMKNVNKEKNNDKIKKSNVKVCKGIMSVAACTLVLAVGVGIGASGKFNSKNTQNEVSNIDKAGNIGEASNVGETGNAVIEEQNIENQISDTIQTDYNNAVMEEFINKKIESVVAEHTTSYITINNDNNVIAESYELSSNINNAIFEILNKLKTIEPDSTRDLGVESFMTRLDENVEVHFSNGYVFQFVYNTDANTLYAHLHTGQESFVYSYYDKDVIKEIVKIMDDNKIKKNEYISLDSTYYSTIIPKDWEGKYDTKVYIDYNNGVTYDVLVRKDNQEIICGVLIFRGADAIKEYTKTDHLGIMLKGGYGAYSCYFATSNITSTSLEKYFSNKVGEQIMEMADNIKLKNMEARLNDEYDLYYKNNPNSNIISADVRYGTDYFDCNLPATWEGKIAKIDDTVYKMNKDDIYYEVKGMHNNEYVTAFSVMVSESKAYSESNWVCIGSGNNNKYIYIMQNFVCRDGDGKTYTEEDYKFEEETKEVIEKLKVKYTVRNEFGSADSSKDLSGKYFIRGEAGTNYRSYVYYISDGYIYRVNLVDGFLEEIIASSAGSLEYNEKEHKIYAQPKNGESFTNNIVVNDEYIVFCQ